MNWVQSMAASLAWAFPAPASPLPEPPKAAALAVVAVGHCNAPSSAISVRSFRALLKPKLGAALQSEADTAPPFGGLSERTLEEVERAVATARKDFYAHKVDAAVQHLKELAVDVTRLAPSVDRWRVERDLVTLLAQAQSATNPPAAEAAMVSLLRVEPSYQPDRELYPPTFRKLVDGIRARQAETPTNRLDIAVSPTGRPVYIGGYPVGAAPLSHHFPAGEYRVEADFGHRSLVRTVLVPALPALAPPVELALSIEGALLADGGPCVEPGPDRGASLARVATLVGATRLFGVRSETAPGHHWMVVEQVDAAGNLVREARSPVQTDAPETDALGALAEWAATGRAGTAVEALKGGSTASASAGKGGQVSGRVVGQPTPSGFVLQSFPVSGQIAPTPGVHFPGDRFTRGEQAAGKTSVRVVTDDGRVGTAVVEVPAGGNVEVNIRVEPACKATGRVRTADGQPAGGASVTVQQVGSRISQTVQTGPKGGFLVKELAKGAYELTVKVGEQRVVRRFSVADTCSAELGVLVPLDSSSTAKQPGDGRGTVGPRYH